MLDGIIVINKPKGYTSNDVVQKVKKIFRQKVGHTGTLDPNATGVLPLLVGKGTKLSYYLINHDKEYTATLKLGIKTTTADIEGEIIEERKVDENLLKEENISKIEKILKSFIGKQSQIPPIYSAIKVNGKKLYEYARKGQEVEIKARDIEIYNMELKSVNNSENTIVFSAKCSKGTYIRSLCEDVAKALGTIGYMLELERTTAGDFDIQNTVNIDDLEKNVNNEEYINLHFITIEDFFKVNEKIMLNKKNIELFLNGVKLTYKKDEGQYRIYDEKNKFIGIGIIKDKLLKREIV